MPLSLSTALFRTTMVLSRSGFTIGGMMRQEEFDPYRKWLGIPPKDQPPNHYRLLSLELFEDDPDAISNAADRQMAHLRTFQTGPHSSLSQRLLNECSAARLCLLSKEKKATYDGGLRKQTAPATKPPALAPAPLARHYAPPVPVAPTSMPAVEVPIRLSDPYSVRRSVRRKKSFHGPVVISLACALAVILGLVFWQSQKNQDMAPSTRKQASAVVVTEAETDADPTVSPAEQRAEESANNNDDQEAMDGEEIEGHQDSVPSDPDEPPGEIDDTPSEMPLESAEDEEMTDGATPANQPADEETTAAMPPEEPGPESAGKKSQTKPKRARSDKKPAKSRRPRLVPKDAILNNGHWYWFSANKATPEQAQLHAFNLNGRLVTITSADENAFVAGHVKGPMLLGMLKARGVWMNSAGFVQGYYNWDRGQPSSARNEIYAAIHSNGVWHDYLRDTLLYCIEWGNE